MRVRLSHVTNRSSSSFIIDKRHLDDDQIKAIYNHIELSKKLGSSAGAWADEHDRWDITENDLFISGYTFIDNFDMDSFLKDIDVNSKVVSWSEYPFKLPEVEVVEVNDEIKEVIEEWRRLIHEM